MNATKSENMTEQDRLARALFDSAGHMPGTYPWWKQPKSTKEMYGKQAEKLLAAGFGDKAEAWDEGLDTGRDRWMDNREFGSAPVNPYR